MLKEMEERERSRFGEMLEERYKARYRERERQREGEKVRDSRMKIAGPVLSKAK